MRRRALLDVSALERRQVEAGRGHGALLADRRRRWAPALARTAASDADTQDEMAGAIDLQRRTLRQA
jgi:hypothetical protein